MRRCIAATIVLLTLGGTAWAFDSKGQYVGRFNYSCPQVLELYGRSELQKDGAGVTFNRRFSVIIGWMAGYMSRVNATVRGKAEFFEHMADEAAWIAQWCEANQKSDLMDAMEALVKERTSKKKTPAAAPAKPKAPAQAGGPAKK
ncbi:MAG: hypothetical protein R3229_16510 [Alphaproteobacteria bacterium]|nr:hypothetical protein [Alphaproteobacteria bacterium]